MLRSTGIRASRLRLYPEEFFKIPIIIPPKDEQQKIVGAITTTTQSRNTAIARTEREIALMQEYRTRLTADLVTGKLDVREAAAKLPVEALELQTLDEMEDLSQDESVASDDELEAAE
jgi:type I restriction enzyme S subunit